MYKITLYTNDGTNKNLSCIVSKSQYNRILNSQNLGGFKRFEIDLFSDKEPKQKSEINFALSFLSVHVFGCTVEDMKKFI
jgi:hypothetical protein